MANTSALNGELAKKGPVARMIEAIGGGSQPWGQFSTPEGAEFLQRVLTTPLDSNAVAPPPRPITESTRQQISALDAALAGGRGAFDQMQLARGIGQQEVAGGPLGEAAAYMTPLGSLMAAEELYQDPTQRTPGRFMMELMPGAGDVRDLSRGLGGLFALQASRATAKQAPQQLIDVGGKNLSRFLTEPEMAKLKNTRSAASFMDLLNVLPDAKEMATVAEAGVAKRGWYEASAKALQNIFGQDAPRFAGLLAATSPQTNVQSNLLNASNIFKNWHSAGRPSDPRLFDIINRPGVAGALTLKKRVGNNMVRIPESEARSIFKASGGDDSLFDLGRSQLQIMGNSVEGERGVDSVLDAWVGNTIRSLNVPEKQMGDLVLSGPKVDSFMRNLVGNTVEVTNDTWIANYLGIPQDALAGSLNPSRLDPGKGPAYIATNVLTRKAAEIVSKRWGEKVAPSEVQEMVWSWAKAVYERAKSQGMKPIDLLKEGKLTDAMINDTPDYAKLLNDPDLPYRKILKEGGFNVGSPETARAIGSNKTREIMSRNDTLRRDLQRAAKRLQRMKGDQLAIAALTPLVVVSLTQIEKENLGAGV
jgi:hypothetical protein